MEQTPVYLGKNKHNMAWDSGYFSLKNEGCWKVLEFDKYSNAWTFSLVSFKQKEEDKQLAVLERLEHAREKEPEGTPGPEMIWQTAPRLAQCSTQFFFLVKYQFCSMTFLDFSQSESGTAGKEYVICHL